MLFLASADAYNPSFMHWTCIIHRNELAGHELRDLRCIVERQIWLRFRESRWRQTMCKTIVYNCSSQNPSFVEYSVNDICSLLLTKFHYVLITCKSKIWRPSCLFTRKESLMKSLTAPSCSTKWDAAALSPVPVPTIWDAQSSNLKIQLSSCRESTWAYGRQNNAAKPRKHFPSFARHGFYARPRTG